MLPSANHYSEAKKDQNAENGHNEWWDYQLDQNPWEKISSCVCLCCVIIDFKHEISHDDEPILNQVIERNS